MANNLLKTLVRHKLIKASDDIKSFLEGYPKEVIAKLESVIDELVVLAGEDIESSTLKELLKNKIEALNISLEPSNLESIFLGIAQKAHKAIKENAKEMVGYSFDSVDKDAIEAMRKNFYWLSQEYNAKIQEELKNIIEDAFRGDVERTNLPKMLREQFGYVIDRDERYFRGVADHIILQNQNIARVLQGEKYGVTHYKIVATIDKRTSRICRSMHGRIIEAKHLEEQVRSIINARSMSAKKGAAAWRSEPMFGKTLPSNFGLPPYHFRCRTEALPVWIDEEEREEDGKKYRLRSTSKDAKYKIAHIDRGGVEAKIKPNIYEKIAKKHGISERQMVGVLNDIKYKSLRGDGKVIALSNGGYVVVYDGDEVVSIFKPSSDPKKYFHQNAQGEIVDIESGEMREKVKKWLKDLLSA